MEQVEKKVNTFINYLIVAVIALLADFLTSNMLYYVLAENVYIAHIAGLIVGFGIQYTMLFTWVYEKDINLSTFFYFFSIFIFGFIVNNLIFIFNINILAITMNYAKILAVGVTFFINFFIRTYLIEKL